MEFELRIIELHWADGSSDDPDDLCLHGKVFVRIGDEIVDEGIYRHACGTLRYWTVSAGAYRMLESVYSDHAAGYERHLLTCCGHFMYIDEEADKLFFIDCPYGLDWSVAHEGDTVTLTTEAKTQVTISLADYRDIVFAFADEIKAFYEKCSPKTPPLEDFEQLALERFWTDWERWRSQKTHKKPPSI